MVTLSKVLVFVQLMERNLAAFTAQQYEVDEITVFVATLKEQLRLRFHDLEKNALYADSTILDPRFKKKGFRTEDSFLKASELLKRRICEVKLPQVQQEENISATAAPSLGSATFTTSSTEPQNAQVASIWDEFDKKMAMIIRPENNTAAAIREYDHYMREPYLPRKDDPLKWWHKKKEIYPRVYQYMLKRLEMQATSVSCERVFSSAVLFSSLLCLDGGGIRGLVLVQILINLEAAIGRPIIHCFDWVAGTSTGGILALALASGKTLRECQRLYFRMKEYAFVGMRPYPSEALETILKDCLGTETVMADLKHPKLMILAVLADRKPVDLHLFRNYQSAQDILDAHNKTSNRSGPEAGDSIGLAPPPPPSEQLVWQAARATGAAPSYFTASGRYLDGGLMGNNPTLDALTELAEMRLALRATGQAEEARLTELRLVVSAGTGLNPLSKVNDYDVFKPESVWGMAKLAWGLTSIGKLLVDQATQADGRVVERARAWCSTLGVPYYRFCPPLSKDVAMDERNDEVLVRMLWETHAYMRQHRDRVNELAAILREELMQI
ncbi:85/88 kDa calcium-independent phospholipase A2-like [Choristoneura fumiferana]|uniref:85/88 kDa calcium-independent phospholipase A2-like n=1 Tax=Choristoneura fumiferana TaxID=7141 RepID=UPI003D159EB5